MKIPSEPFDREEQDTALVTALTHASATRLYLDTSALVWLYRIREKARAELVQFLDSPELKSRSHIPAWSLHELNKHRKSPKTLFPLVEQHARLVSAVEQIRANARLFVDDKFAGGTKWSTASAYFAALDAACAALEKVAKPLNKPGEVRTIDAELAPFLRDHALRETLPDLALLRDEFLARCEGRLPPGYEDSNKTSDSPGDANFSGANRFGDYVFWRSVVEHAASDPATSVVVIVSHDAKRDWIHLPSNYIGYGEPSSSNNKKGSARVTCPHPFLSFEIEVEAGVDRLFIVSIMQLVSAFSQTGAGAQFKELARAIQIDETAEAEKDTAKALSTDVDAGTELGDLEQPNGEPAQEVEELEHQPENPQDVNQNAPAPGGNEAAEGVLGRLHHLPPEALADAAYEPGENEADTVLKGLKSHNWYQQNPAVLGVPGAIRDEETSDVQLFLIGRNLYQAACGSAWRAVDFLPSLARRSEHGPAGAYEIVFAGAAYEGYFDGTGNIREYPKDEQLGIVFNLAEQEAFADAVEWIHAQLEPVFNRLILVPGAEPRRAKFVVSVDALGIPTGIEFEDVQITENAMPDEDGWDPQALPVRGTNERMTQALAAHFRLPPERIDIEPPIEDVLNFARLRLKPWSTHAGLEFPE